jgi:Hemerythrin HHE cation binding domain
MGRSRFQRDRHASNALPTRKTFMKVATTVKSLVARALMAPDDVRILLQRDHDEALDLAEKMQKATQPSRRKEILKKLKPALAAHSRAEEKEVYNALLKLKKAKKSQDIANEGFVEHSLLDELLDGLARGAATSDSWKAKAKVLHELLDHHVSEEKTQMFVDLGEHFTSEQLIAMGARFERTKQALLKKRTRRSS